MPPTLIPNGTPREGIGVGRSKKNAPQPEPQPEQEAGGVKPLFLRLPPAYHNALATLARRGRRTLTSEAMIALEAHFQANGLRLEDFTTTDD